MTTNILSPTDWPDLIRRIQAGDPSVGSAIAERERRFDNFFDNFSSPNVAAGTLYQGAVACSVALNEVYGHRVGNWVTIKGLVVVSALATAGVIELDPPAAFPINYSRNLPVTSHGTFSVYSNATGVSYLGEVQLLTLPGPFRVQSHNSTGFLGTLPAYQLNTNDLIRYSLAYQVESVLV